MTIVYEREKQFVTDNWIGVDKTNKFFIDSNLSGDTGTISAKNGEFTSLDDFCRRVKSMNSRSLRL